MASLFAVLIVAVNASPLPASSQPWDGDAVMIAQADGGRSFRRSDIEEREPPREFRRPVVDCHRDVRTHRINGERVRHRHVGDNCEIRIVRQSTEPAHED